ncbi:MAG: hypothetical protein PHN75_07000 [Syntrophales bacterium]|nr:hypothetical protein [Syntrophales bacterium]
MLTHSIDLMRFTAGERAKVLSLLNRMQSELVEVINNGATQFSKSRARALIKESDRIIKDYYREAADQTDLTGLAEHEAEYHARSLSNIGLDAALPSETVMKSLVSNMLIEGTPAAAWWARQGEDTAFRFSNQVRQGMVQNETLGQIVYRITGKPGIPGVMEISRKNATALVHSSVMTVSGDARMATWKENADVVKGIRQLSTLDGHTTPICLAYAGKEWDLDGKPIGHSLPWVNSGGNPAGGPPRHWGCRSTTVPVLKSLKEVTGLDVPDREPGTRASDLGQIKADITMDEWLKMHPDSFADDLLGKGRAQLWRDGKITLRQLVDGQGREMTLEQLKKRAK